ncbi:sulfatase-like hydrolase/transferase [Paenibacillus rhizovicinus]|uniref:Sulfatase-like hydrolase/transferase n=1 Tax=Paenibacillus rhizovicinus TaxID=2704463 RepID=A0A6C0NVA3_9BACL|nr:sulfatase-like hydrolase/transferase [Paenibacillus rhizovicinus]QHW30119.1 sulfatase-like hydrolase/transferase [Paenibacillus rhizovicinus]
MSNRPHILIFNPDQWRADVVGHFGNQAAVTPNLDRLVETEAVSFRHAYCQNPVCTPSRCSFMSGWYPHVRGHRTMFHMMHEDEPVLLKTLKDEGYTVWWGGKNDLIPADTGFGAYCDIKYVPEKRPRPETNLHAADGWRGDPEGDNYYSFYAGKLEKATDEELYYDGDWAMVLGAIDFIRSAPKDKPICIYLPLLYPHPPYGVEEPWFGMIDRNKMPLRTPAPDWSRKPSMLKGIFDRQKLQGWNEERWRELRATYYGMCARVDHQFGLLLDALKETEIYDDTAVFFFSDHGDFTGDYGLVEKTQNTFEDCLTNVPFVIKPPLGVKTAPRVSEALVELIDFPATVEALLGLTPCHTHFGRSLLPVLAGETDEHRDAVFAEGGRLHGELQAMELESTSMSEPSGLYWPRVGLQQLDGPEHTKAVMCRTRDYKYVRRFYEQDELYDLKCDPMEVHNRIDDASLADVLAALKERLLTFYMETADAVPLKTDRRT